MQFSLLDGGGYDNLLQGLGVDAALDAKNLQRCEVLMSHRKVGAGLGKSNPHCSCL